MRTEAEMKCDVCGCVTGHLTIAKPPKRPKDECQKCYWTRELNVDGLKAERDAAVAEAWRLNAVEMLKKSAETDLLAALTQLVCCVSHMNEHPAMVNAYDVIKKARALAASGSIDGQEQP
jgi:hypothetical protein